ncbi:hypothetical protein MCSV2_50073 [Mucispirillum schaedleri ASF457]|nr:hypothetical protein MCSV2_50073 [Mucispirillum schaedleri ASF457]
MGAFTATERGFSNSGMNLKIKYKLRYFAFQAQNEPFESERQPKLFWQSMI